MSLKRLCEYTPPPSREAAADVRFMVLDFTPFHAWKGCTMAVARSDGVIETFAVKPTGNLKNSNSFAISSIGKFINIHFLVQQIFV